MTDEEIDAIADDNDMGKTWYENNPQKHWRAFARSLLAAQSKQAGQTEQDHLTSDCVVCTAPGEGGTE